MAVMLWFDPLLSAQQQLLLVTDGAATDNSRLLQEQKWHATH